MFTCKDGVDASQAARTELADLLRLQQATVTAKASRGACMLKHWCSVWSQRQGKIVLMSEASPRFVTRLAGSESARRNLNQEFRGIAALCQMQDGLVADRIPWTGAPLKGALPGAVETWPQQRVHGRWFRVRDGTTFYATAVRTIVGARAKGGDAAAATIGWQIFDDLVRWERFLALERLLVDDLQFLLTASGQVWLLDVRDTLSLTEHDQDPLDGWGLRRPEEDVQRVWRQSVPTELRRSYAHRRQRASLLSFALATAVATEELAGTARKARAPPGHAPRLRRLLCDEAVCELGRVVAHVLTAALTLTLALTKTRTRSASSGACLPACRQR